MLKLHFIQIIMNVVTVYIFRIIHAINFTIQKYFFYAFNYHFQFFYLILLWKKK